MFDLRLQHRYVYVPARDRSRVTLHLLDKGKARMERQVDVLAPSITQA